MSFFQDIWQSLDPRGSFFLAVALVFLGVSGLITIFLLIRRVSGARREEQLEQLRSNYQESLNNLVILAAVNELTEEEYNKSLAELKSISDRSRLAKEVLIDLMVRLRKNISGASATILERIFAEVGLGAFSKSRLHYTPWKVKAKVIQDLTEMNALTHEELQQMQDHARQQTLKEAILISMIRVDHSYSLHFLDAYDGPLSYWMMVNLHHQLAQVEPRHLPVFSKWFNSRSDEVVIFCVRMTQQFRQIESVEALVPLLRHSSTPIVAATIQALADLEAYQVADRVTQLAELFYQNSAISMNITRFLGRLSSNDEHLALLEKYLVHPSFDVRFEAVKALMKMPNYGRERLLAEHVHREDTLFDMVKHASEPLLQ